ncbi:MAG: cytochrome c [Nitrospira sp.]|nr:cytochrome c [Nitrospira sp.]
MTENRSRVYMTMVLVFGGAGLFVAGSLSSCMMPMMGMMGMDEKNDQGHMKEMMQQMMGGMLPPGITPQDLPEPESRGAKLLSRYCSQCHNLPSPRMHTAEDWPRIAGRMLSRERMMAGMHGMMMRVKAPASEEEEALLQYLKTHAMQALSPTAIPESDSPGAALFLQTCAQCHALPEPKQHMASEWTAVVERMRQNMKNMGRREITVQEARDITAYLERHSREIER